MRVHDADHDERHGDVRNALAVPRSGVRRSETATSASVASQTAEQRGRWCDVAHGFLDEHERRAPDSGEQEQHREVAPAHRERTVRDAQSVRTVARRIRFPDYLGYLTAVAEQPLHRALGLTDGELERIRGLLERDPNRFELAVFSLLWSSTAATSTRRRCAGCRRPASASFRARRERGRARPRRRRGGRVQGGAQPSVRGGAVPGSVAGIGGILRDVVAMGARPIALLDGLRFGAPDGHFWRAVAGIAATGTALGSRRSAARRCSTPRTPTTASSTRCAWGCCRRSA